MKRSASGILLYLALSVAHAQPSPPLGFERLHSGDGLSHNSVYAILQDQEGFMWFGTVDGLNRYDGYTFEVYRHDAADSTSLSHNLVYTLFEDDDGALWVGTQDGIDRKPFGAERFERYAIEGHPETGVRSVYRLVEDEAGTLWASSAMGLLRYVEAEDRFVVHRAVESLGILDIQARPDGLWVLFSGEDGTSGTLYQLEAGTGDELEAWVLPGTWGALNGFAFDAEGALWPNHKGPGRRDGSVLRPAHPGPDDSAYAFLALADGSVLIGSAGGGLYRCSEAAACSRQRVDAERSSWLHNFTRAIYQDRMGTIWVGTYGGVYRSDPHRKAFSVYRHDLPIQNRTQNDAIAALAQAPDGARWVGTYGAGMSRMLAGSTRLEPVSDPGSVLGTVIWDLLVDADGTLWVGTAQGLAHYEERTGRFRTHPTVNTFTLGSAVTVLEEGEGGTLWVGSFMGLMHYDPQTGSLTTFPVTGDDRGPSQRPVTAMLRDGAVLWLGLHGGEVNQMDLTTLRFETVMPSTASGIPQPSEATYDLDLDGRGGLWIASGAGLFRYDIEGESFDHYTTQDGLPGSVVYSIQPDGEARLWLGTNRGLARFDPVTGAVRAYDLSDGIGSMEFNRHARYRDPDGTLLFGGGEGLLQFHPDGIRDDTSAAPVVLTTIESASRKGTTTYNPRGLVELILAPGEKTVTFAFAALGFTDPVKNRYRYRLDGFDADWVEAGAQRQARYTNLPPGTFTLHVRAANQDGIWNEVGLALPVRVLPAFWQTLWFRLFVALSVLGGVAFAYRVRVNRLLAMERFRLRIAGDLHDDLSSDLSGIALASDLLRQRLQSDDEDRARLVEIRDAALGMVDALRDIVWTINPEHDTLDALVRRMRLVARDLLAEQDYTFDAALPDEASAIPMPIRRDLLLLYKEGLHNVTRHAQARTVSIRLWREGTLLLLRIADDGVGFNGEGRPSGYGLTSMKARAERIGGTLDIDTAPGRGTTLTVRTDVARTRDSKRRRQPVS